MNTVSKSKVGLVFGLLLALFHLTWALLVALGWAQRLIDLVFRLHFIEPPYRIMPFRIEVAAGLVALTALTGFVTGWVLAAIWNVLLPADENTRASG
jgi:hypothetical protein